jgi:excisionase family DNA binding protein
MFMAFTEPTGEIREHSAGLAQLAAEVRALRVELRANAHSAVAISVEEAGRRLGCGRTKVFELLKLRKLRSVPKQGRARLVTTASVDALLSVPEPERCERKGKPKTMGRLRRSTQDLVRAIQLVRV